MKEVVEKALNEQIKLEAESSQLYLSMASWCEVQGYSGSGEFLYRHAEEERGHMMKLFRFVNERGGHALVPKLEAPQYEFESLMDVFERVLEHEIFITNLINELVFLTLDQKDYTTHNFLQWFVSEQIEEEGVARTNIDKLKLTGGELGGMYLFDRDMEQFFPEENAG